MRAEIISIGTELLLGQIVDTNAAFLASELPDLGIDLYFISQVGDNLSRLSETLRRAWGRSDLIITTGGLGPTEDDVTREAIAAMLGEEMVVVPTLEQALREFFARRGRTMTQSNLKQATLIPSATAIPNPVGTAPGWWVERDGRIIIAMPGVPTEMMRMWREEAKPRLRRLPHRDGQVIVSRTIKVLGLGESAAEEKIRHLLHSTNPTIGTYAKQDGIHLRLTAKACSEAEARALITPVEQEICRILGTHVYGYDDDTPASVVGHLLRQRGLTLATAEVGTGGMLAHAMSDAPHCAAYYRGGIVAPGRDALNEIGMPTSVVDSAGLVSQTVAEVMALSVRVAFGATIGLAITATVADEGAVPAGTVYAAVHDGQVRSVSMVYPTLPSEIRRLAVLAALNMLRLHLLERPL